MLNQNRPCEGIQRPNRFEFDESETQSERERERERERGGGRESDRLYTFFVCL